MRIAVLAWVMLGLASGGTPVSWTGGSTGGSLTVRPEPVQFRRLELDGRPFVSVDMAGAGVWADYGTPALPWFRRLVEVPLGAEVTVVSEVGAVDTVVLDAAPAPRQEPVPKSGPVPEFRFDAKAYAEDSFSPPISARLSEFVEVRGHRIAVVDIFPVACNPARRQLVVARELKVLVNWVGADWSATQATHRRYSSPAFAGRLSQVVLNTERFALDDGPSLPVGFLVIVPDDWEPNVRPLAEWRRRKGYNVFVRNLTEVGGGSASAVKAYIQNAYDNWPIPPSFVLLVGDVDRIGYFTGGGQGNPPTDLNFACVAGSDYLPDIDVSRVSVANQAQLDSFVSNVVRYEQTAGIGGTGWLERAYFIASSDGGNHQVAERTHAYVMSRLRPKGVVCDSLWLYYGTGTSITSAVNSGRAWVTYSGHGAEDAWADPSPDFDLAAVHGLENVDLIPYVQTYACYSGNFASSSYPECFSEAWIRNGRRGAIAHVASSVTSYWTEDDTLERRVFDCMFDSAATWIMGGWNKARLWYFRQMGSGSTTRRYLEMYNLMGDGAIDVYSHEPERLTVGHPVVIPLGVYALSVTVNAGSRPVPNALVCVTAKQDTSVFAVGYTDAAGRVILTFTTVQPDSIYVTVTGHNLEPYLGGALALPSTGPYIAYLRHVVDDSAGGNRDGVINPGETINLPVWLKNWGSSGAEDVRAWLYAADSGAVVNDSLREFGSIGAGDSAFSGQAGFGFTVAPSCTNQHVLRFGLVAKDGQDSSWVSPLLLTVGAPVVRFGGYQADDPPPGGNGNGMIDPGESGDVIVTLRNQGQGNAYGVTAILRSGDARLCVLDSVGSFGDIPADSSVSNSADRFSVRADGSIPRETRVTCTLAVRVGGRTELETFQLEVGAVRSCDPIPDGPRTPARYYAYDVTDTAYSEAPEFSWFELRGIGTRLTLGDDETRVVSLPEEFGPLVWYGQRFSQISICGNGWAAPGATTASAYANTTLPDGTSPGIIACCWDDLYPPQGGGVLYYFDPATRRFIVEWDSVHYYSPRAQWDSYQLIFCDSSVRTPTGDNVVIAQYLTANNYSAVTVGIEDPQSVIGINYLCNGVYHRGAAEIVPGMAVKYTTNPPLPRVGWSEADNRFGPPTRVGLHSGTPNPFRTSTRITYAVPRPMQLQLAVYDRAGRVVKVLVDGQVEPGNHHLCWNGTDALGRRLPAGIYLVRLKSDNASLVQKTVLVD